MSPGERRIWVHEPLTLFPLVGSVSAKGLPVDIPDWLLLLIDLFCK